MPVLDTVIHTSIVPQRMAVSSTAMTLKGSAFRSEFSARDFKPGNANFRDVKAFGSHQLIAAST
jgi:hypothetical protein